MPLGPHSLFHGWFLDEVVIRFFIKSFAKIYLEKYFQTLREQSRNNSRNNWRCCEDKVVIFRDIFRNATRIKSEFFKRQVATLGE